MNEYDPVHHETVAKIVKRVLPDPSMTGESPTFLVRFGDGEQRVAISEQLRPWYPT